MMRNFRILLRNEIRVLFFTPSTYVASVLFLALMALVYWTILRGYIMTGQDEFPATPFFRAFWIPAFFVVPLITMRSLADERRLGTLETLLTTPSGSLAIVLAKFAASYLLYALLWALTLLFPVVAVTFAGFDQAAPVLLNGPANLGGFTFVLLSGTLFIGIGIFASSLTRSQLVAGMLTFTGLFLVVAGSRLLVEIPSTEDGVLGMLEPVFNYLQVFQHFIDFSKGVVDTRPFVYYLSYTALCLGLAVIMVERKA